MRGFTLVELLIAIFIVALLGAGAAMLLRSTLDNHQTLSERGQALAELGMGLTLIRRDLEQIAPRRGRDRYGDAREHVLGILREGDSSLLEFTRDGRRNLPGQTQGSSLERVRYEVEEEQLIRYSAPVPDPASHTDWQRQVLMENVRRLDFRYYDGDEWHDAWPPVSRTASTPELPPAISIEVETRLWRDLNVQVLLPGA